MRLGGPRPRNSLSVNDLQRNFLVKQKPRHRLHSVTRLHDSDRLPCQDFLCASFTIVSPNISTTAHSAGSPNITIRKSGPSHPRITLSKSAGPLPIKTAIHMITRLKEMHTIAENRKRSIKWLRVEKNFFMIFFFVFVSGLWVGLHPTLFSVLFVLC